MTCNNWKKLTQNIRFPCEDKVLYEINNILRCKNWWMKDDNCRKFLQSGHKVAGYFHNRSTCKSIHQLYLGNRALIGNACRGEYLSYSTLQIELQNLIVLRNACRGEYLTQKTPWEQFPVVKPNIFMSELKSSQTSVHQFSSSGYLFLVFQSSLLIIQLIYFMCCWISQPQGSWIWYSPLCPQWQCQAWQQLRWRTSLASSSGCWWYWCYWEERCALQC